MLPADATGSLPGLGQGVFQSMSNGASSSLGQLVQTIPNVAQTETVVTEDCACTTGSE